MCVCVGGWGGLPGSVLCSAYRTRSVRAQASYNPDGGAAASEKRPPTIFGVGTWRLPSSLLSSGVVVIGGNALIKLLARTVHHATSVPLHP